MQTGGGVRTHQRSKHDPPKMMSSSASDQKHMCTQHHLPGTEGGCLYSACRIGSRRSCTSSKQRRLREGATLQGTYINWHTCPFLDVRCFSNHIWLARHPQFLVLRVVTGQL